MKKLLILLSILTFCSLSGQEEDVRIIEKFLKEEVGISFNRINLKEKNSINYELEIRQPLDWKNEQKGYFIQRVIFSHTGFDKPMVMETQGYQLYNGKNEIQQILNANSLNIEHRFFGVSVPDSLNFNWKDLNMYNVARDLHHINKIFKKLYKEKWISTGISKGGQTAIYYKYFFPEDVDVSIPYVAPINYGLEDKRIYTFLNGVGADDCRNKIKDFQIYMLKNEEEALKYIKAYSDVRGLTYDYIGSLEKAFEYTVLEYSFSFWQWGYLCEDIPQNPDIVPAVEHLLKVVDIGFFGDQEIKNLAPHYYQAATEMGYYGYDITSFKPYLKNFSENPSAIFAPKEAGEIEYSPDLNNKLKKWLETQADNMIYIYGNLDTWSATKVDFSPHTNSLILVLPNANHRTARILNMDNMMRDKLSQALYNWIGIKPNYSLLYQ